MKIDLRTMGWKDLPVGGHIPEAGCAHAYKTGGWRTFKPVLDKEKCISCLQCWIYCPDSSILVKDDTLEGYDYDHCKGCGICAKICPVKAITMEKEGS